jgi:hypothetical protein
MSLSPHVKERLIRFKELCEDPSYGRKRAIEGLKSYRYSQTYRITEKDSVAIKLAIHDAETLIKIDSIKSKKH